MSGRKNVHSIYSGHHDLENISYRMDRGDFGNLVFQSFQNWQETDRGGEGRYLVVTYDRAAKERTIQVVNPLQGEVKEHACFSVGFPLEAKETTLHYAPQGAWKSFGIRNLEFGSPEFIHRRYSGFSCRLYRFFSNISPIFLGKRSVLYC